MTPRKNEGLLERNYTRLEIEEIAQIIDEHRELAADLYSMSLYAERLVYWFAKRHKDHVLMLKLLSRIRQRLKDYYNDAQDIMRAYQRVIDRYEHTNGPLFYQPKKQMVEYTIPIQEVIGVVTPFEKEIADIYG